MEVYNPEAIRELSAKVKTAATVLTWFLALEGFFLGVLAGSAIATATNGPGIIYTLFLAISFGVLGYVVGLYIFSLLKLAAESALCLASIESHLAVPKASD